MSRVMIKCPYGHDGEVSAVPVKSARHGKEHLLALHGIKCSECGRVFVHEHYAFPIYGGIDYLIVAQYPVDYIYELDGPWTGQRIDLFVESNYS